MYSIHKSAYVAATVLGLLSTTRCVQAVDIATVPVGNPGNPDDARYADVYNPNGFGGVNYEFRIGKFEVTNSQYTEFLNAAAKADPLGLYSGQMSSSGNGGIVRSGTPGNYSYAVKPGLNQGGRPFDQLPVVFVSWFDTVRFANWLNNGQGGPGTTEYGAYTLEGNSSTPTNWRTITRNPGATWWLTSEDEWYKAAYYDPRAGVYYDFPTGSNVTPSADRPPGGPESANFALCCDLATPVGAYVDAKSPYGTYDQGGNVTEWNDSYPIPIVTTYRGIRGGDSASNANALRASDQNGIDPTRDVELSILGFRVATVPEPAGIVLCLTGAISVAGLPVRKRRRPPVMDGNGLDSDDEAAG